MEQEYIRKQRIDTKTALQERNIGDFTQDISIRSRLRI